MKKLEAIARQFKDGAVDGKTAAFEIIRLVRQYKGYFNVQIWDDEVFDDFIFSEVPHIISLLKQFEFGHASFSTFFYRALQVSSAAYRRKQATVSLREKTFKCMNDLMSEEMAYRYAQDEADLRVEAACAEDELRRRTGQLLHKKHAYLMNMVRQKHYRSRRKEKLEDLRRLACLVLFLKSSAVADDASIRNTSIVTGISEDRLFSMMTELKETVDKKRCRRERSCQARDSAFFLRRKYRIQALNGELDGSRHQSVCKYYTVHSERWRKNNDLIEHKLSIAPSNRDIGALLHVSERKIARILWLARRKINQIRLDENGES